jgi:methionyl-tRNA formyltransferase
MLNIVFMGTPDFAVPSLDILHKHHNIKAVVTVPDKAAGRGRKIRQSPVKKYAEKHGIPCLQPEKLKDESFVSELKRLAPDLMVVVAFRMLPKEAWKIPRFGTFNLHASLLPDYRGAAPINHAIINGDKETGLTTFFIDEQIDTGEILMQEATPIHENDTAGSLHDRLMQQGADLVLKTVNAIESNSIKPRKQPMKANPVKAPKIFKQDCKINWQQDGKKIYNFIRGLSPYPAAWTRLENDGEQSTMKVFEADFIGEKHTMTPGSIRISDTGHFDVAVAKGFIRLNTIQPESKKPMTGKAFLQGYNIDNSRFV